MWIGQFSPNGRRIYIGRPSLLLIVLRRQATVFDVFETGGAQSVDEISQPELRCLAIRDQNNFGHPVAVHLCRFHFPQHQPMIEGLFDPECGSHKARVFAVGVFAHRIEIGLLFPFLTGFVLKPAVIHTSYGDQ